MGIWQEAKNWVSTRLASVSGLPVPDTGRSSQDDTLLGRTNAYLGAFVNGEIAPGINFETLRALKTLWIHNADLSQAVANLVALANTGHQITITANGSRRVEGAIRRLNETAKRIYPNSLGVDGLINDAIAQAAWSGAFAREDVIDLNARRVKEVVLVSPEEIRFVPKDGAWVPYQQPRNGLLALDRSNSLPGYVALHPTTFRYYRIGRVDASPYAKPPFTAALGPLLDIQADMNAQLKRIVQRFGLFGMLSVAVTPPPWEKSKQTFEEYRKTAQQYLAATRKGFEDALASGSLKNLLVTFKEQEVKTTPSTGDAKGAAELYDRNEEQVFSGLNSMGFMFGRNFTTTETFADVVWYVMASQAQAFQWLARFGVERTYSLDLALAGVEVDDVYLQFNPLKSRNMLTEAQARQIEQQIVFSDLDRGMIGPDQAAQQLGYEKAFDPSLSGGTTEGASQKAGLSALGAANAFTASFSYDRHARAYRYSPPRIEVVSAGLAEGNVFDFGLGKKKVRLKHSS